MSGTNSEGQYGNNSKSPGSPGGMVETCDGKQFDPKVTKGIANFALSSDYKILEIITNHLTKALYNYQLIDIVERKKTELNMKLLELETLFDISVAISSVLDTKELGNEIFGKDPERKVTCQNRE